MSDALTQFAKHAVCASSVLGDAKTPKEPKLGKDRAEQTQGKASWRRGTLAGFCRAERAFQGVEPAWAW